MYAPPADIPDGQDDDVGGTATDDRCWVDDDIDGVHADTTAKHTQL